MKSYFVTIIALLFFADAFAQDTLTLFVNGRKAGERIVSDTPAVMEIKKIKIKNVAVVSLRVKPASYSNVFKRTIQITNAGEQNLFSINESSSKRGWYTFNLSRNRTKLLRHGLIRIFLSEDPANSMMKIRSVRKLLAELHFK